MSQNYVFVQRALTGGATIVDDSGRPSVQNVSEFMSYLNETYLSQGYEIHTITHLPANADAPQVMQYAYHLVKSLPEHKVAK